MLFRRVVDQSRSFASLDFCSGMGQSEGGLGKLNVTMFIASTALLSVKILPIWNFFSRPHSY